MTLLSLQRTVQFLHRGKKTILNIQLCVLLLRGLITLLNIQISAQFLIGARHFGLIRTVIKDIEVI
jgi:hypothetical protein